MSGLSNTVLWIALFILFLMSAFFSGSETGMMSLNRYRLRHLARIHPGARHALKLLERPDRLLSILLIGNNFANIFASAVVTILTVRLFGDEGVLVATLILTLLLLIFAEITPKTVAALYPNKIAFACALPLQWLLVIMHPIVWLTNMFSNGFLRLLGISTQRNTQDALSIEELKMLVYEGDHRLTGQHKAMLLSILDLEKIYVQDIMVHRAGIMGIDLERPWADILEQLAKAQHSILPVYRQNIDTVVGILHLRRALNLMASGALDEKTLLSHLEEVYFIPAHTPLNLQLIQFQTEKRRTALIVNEYGEILGLLTLSDLLEEIVGEFTSNMEIPQSKMIKQIDGSYLIEGGTLVRDINRILEWDLPNLDARTLNGVITAYLETIPQSAMCVELGSYQIEIIDIKDNLVKMAKIFKKST